MSGESLALQRPPLLRREQLARIEEAAVSLLAEVGIAVHDGALRERLVALGFRLEGDRALIGRTQTSDFLEAERRANGNRFSSEPAPLDGNEARITLHLNPYAQLVHDIEADRLVPLTTERLVEATKLVDVLAERGVGAAPPGCPTDVPAPLQPVVQYWVAATHSPHGRKPVDPKSLPTFPYVMEMADVLGEPIRHLPAYVTSPLALGGESLRCVQAFRDRIESVQVCSMPSAGSTAPVNVADAFALAAAETTGAALLLREALELPVGWTVSLFPVDFASMAMVFGSPEYLLMQWMGAEVDAWFHGRAWPAAGGTALTMAKLPGPQACAERAGLMTAGALLGQRAFEGAGTLSLDEAFSAEQLLYDLEIKDHVEALLRGLDGDCDPERCLREVMEGLEQKGFMGLESTARACRDFWQPALFERSFVATWLAGGARTIRARAHAMIRDLSGRHEYRLEADLQRELDRILARARTELSGTP